VPQRLEVRDVHQQVESSHAEALERRRAKEPAPLSDLRESNAEKLDVFSGRVLGRLPERVCSTIEFMPRNRSRPPLQGGAGDAIQLA
jgi:hypothetical protein